MYSPASFVVAVKVCPRSRSVMVTFARGTTAPLWSFTVPAMVPVSFWAQRNPANSKKRMESKVKRRVRTAGIRGSFTARLGKSGGLRPQLITIFWTVRVNGATFDVYYEHLLLLSFWSDVKNELCSGSVGSTRESSISKPASAQSKI